MDEILKEIKEIKEIIKKSTKETMKKSCKFTVAFYGSLGIVFLLVIGGAIILGKNNNIFSLSEQNKDLYSLVPVLIYILYLIFVFLSIRLLLKSAKYFSKLDILENLMKSGNINDKELIKKYCDTLVDL